MRKMLVRFIREDEGQDLIEYGLIAGIITAATVTTIMLLGPKIALYFSELNTKLPATLP